MSDNINDVEHKNEGAEERSSEITEPKPQPLANLLASFTREVKQLSKNDLVRSYVALYSAYVLLQQRHDILKNKIAEGGSPIPNDGNLINLQNNIAAIAESELKNV